MRILDSMIQLQSLLRHNMTFSCIKGSPVFSAELSLPLSFHNCRSTGGSFYLCPQPGSQPPCPTILSATAAAPPLYMMEYYRTDLQCVISQP